MTFPSHLQRTVALLALTLSSAMTPAYGQVAHGDFTVVVNPAAPVTAAMHLQRVQAELVQAAVTTYRARVVATLPGWRETVRDVERLVEKPWIGLPPVILVVPGVGARGFRCDERESCLGRFIGATVTVRGSDCTLTTMSSIIVIAESALTRRDVWAHELTHALLAQHGMIAESSRHDRRYFAEAQFVTMGF